MLALPSAATELLMSFSGAFSEPTFRRALLLLCLRALLAPRRRTVSVMLRAMRPLVNGHFTSFHRIFCHASWSLWTLGVILTQAIVVVIDDTTAQHRGKHVYGKGCHHGAVRSARRQVVFKWGHRWIVLAIAIRLLFLKRHWALPVAVALYRPESRLFYRADT